jgi:hypothetical protein
MDRGEEDGAEQVPDLVTGQPDLACWGWSLGVFGGGEEGVGEHRQDRRAVP